MKQPILAAALFCACILSPAFGKEIVVGQVAPIQDPKVAGYQLKSGIELYFDAVNRAGGIFGARIRLVAKDRQSQVAAEAVPKTRELITEHKPIALIGLIGTGPMEALVKDGVLESAGLPVVGMRTGGTSLHDPVNPLLFHTRASYAGEAESIARHLNTLGLRKIGILYEDSPFGHEALKLSLAALDRLNIKPVALASYPLATVDVQAAVKVLATAAPQVVIAASSTAAAAQFYKAINQGGGSRVQMVAFSTVEPAAVVKIIGRIDARGLGVSQVVPDPENRRSVIARQFQDDAKKLRDPGFETSQTALEGYIAAKVLVEGLRRSGPDPTPAKLRQSLERITNYDTGGLVISFSPRSHSGTTFVNIGILASDGKLMN